MIAQTGDRLELFEELKRRNVFRVGIAYLLMGWVLLQGADFVLDLVGARIGGAGAGRWSRLSVYRSRCSSPGPSRSRPRASSARRRWTAASPIVPQTGRKLDRAIIVFLALAVVVLLGERFFLGSESAPAPPRMADTSSETASQTRPAYQKNPSPCCPLPT